MIIAFCSPAMYSGKSTAAQHLVERHGFALVKFAGPLKQMTRALLGACGIGPGTTERCVEGDLKEIAIGDLGDFQASYAYLMADAMGPLPDEVEITRGALIESLYQWGRATLTPTVTTRRIMQTLGTEWGRNQVSVDLWVLLARDACLRQERAVIDDMRYMNEYEMVHAIGGLTYRIVRPDAPKSAAPAHSSEGDLDQVLMGEIWNQSSVDRLHEKLDLLIRESL